MRVGLLYRHDVEAASEEGEISGTGLQDSF